MSARARLGVGTGIVLLLAGLLAWQATDRPPISAESRPRATEPARVRAPTVPATTTVPREIAAVELALASWSKFAATGDLAVLGGTFDPEGPQYRQLVAEASVLKLFPSASRHQFEMTEASLRDGPGGPVVRAAVTYGAAEGRSWCWDFHLRPTKDSYRLWTVVEVQNPRTSTVSAKSSGSVAPNICP